MAPWDRFLNSALVDMQKVYVKPDKYGGAGVYARAPIKKGEVVETGIVRVHEGLDGNKCPFVFTWSEAEPRQWASGSGASVFYNMSENPNTHMIRNFDKKTFEIIATGDIAQDEELTHVYISATWRECFKDLKPMAEKYMEKQKQEKDKEASPSADTGKDSSATSVFSCCSTREKEPEVQGDVPGLVDMTKVLVKADAYGGAGAFAKVAIKKDEIIEKGIVRVLPLDGNVCPFVFTWSLTEPRKWASGSGASVFYNMCEDPNTHMERNFEQNSFEIKAVRDISAGEELTHVYISATWRTCFADLKPMAERYLAKQKEAESSS